MIRSTATPDWRRQWTMTFAAGVILVVVGSLAYMALRAAPGPEQAPPAPKPIGFGSPVADELIPAPMPVAQALESPPAAAANPPNPSTPSRPADLPYRFVGKSGSGAETAIVLFGRGRVVTLREPGSLDDEYVVDAVFDDYVVLRHVPTSAATFLPLVQRRKVVDPPTDPEDLPRD